MLGVNTPTIGKGQIRIGKHALMLLIALGPLPLRCTPRPRSLDHQTGQQHRGRHHLYCRVPGRSAAPLFFAPIVPAALPAVATAAAPAASRRARSRRRRHLGRWRSNIGTALSLSLNLLPVELQHSPGVSTSGSSEGCTAESDQFKQVRRKHTRPHLGCLRVVLLWYVGGLLDAVFRQKAVEGVVAPQLHLLQLISRPGVHRDRPA